ncbi:MAG: F0F1 ATP synthase subunit A [bacterium]|nr:F0F1 ATP synthase subunit A [bacterium]
MAEGAAAAGHGAEGGSNFIMDHILDSSELHLPGVHVHLPHLELFGIDLSITTHLVMMWVASLFLILVLGISTRRRGLIPRGVGNVVEALVVFIRDELAIPNIGKKESQKFLPFLFTIFFFILACNLLGLIPFGATATANINVTAALALLAFVMIQVGGMIHNGPFGYFKNLIPHGLPAWLLPIMIPIEIVSLFTKPFALCIRLFANMTAGHVVILSLIGLIFILKSLAVAPASVLFALGVYLLEIFVAFVQAYIFTLLSAVFIGMAVHQEH